MYMNNGLNRRSERCTEVKTYCRLGSERSNNAIGIYLKKVRRPAYFSVGTDFHTFLAVPHLLPVKVNITQMQYAG